jgi:hypothetical protein
MKRALGLGLVGATLAGGLAWAVTRNASTRPVVRGVPTREAVARRKWRPVPQPVHVELARLATALLPLPMGSMRLVAFQGRAFLFKLEPHYHGPEGPPPIGWHKGVTVYEALT